MNIFKRIKFFFEYKRLIKAHKEELASQFNIRVDSIYRLYTVINVPDESKVYGEENAKKLAKDWLKNWLSKFDTFLVDKRVKEFTRPEELSEIDKQNFLLIIRYKYLNMAAIYYTSITLAVLTVLAFLIVLIFKFI